MGAYCLVMRRRMRGIFVGLGMFVYPGQPLVGQFGELPPGHISQQSLGGVRGEIGRILFVDSSVAVRFVPPGFSVVTLQQIATQDTTTARYLASRPHLKTAVLSTLAFVALDSLQIDDRPPMRVVGAFWWLRVRPTRPTDRRVPGEVWVEVAYWSPDTSFVRLERSGWPPMQYAPVTVSRAADGEWQVSLTLPDAVIRGRCRPSGARQAAGYPLPAYTTVWAAGPEPAVFDIYTFHGHHTQECVGEWTADGDNLLAVALNDSPGDLPPWAQTMLIDGWHARAARYRR